MAASRFAAGTHMNLTLLHRDAEMSYKNGENVAKVRSQRNENTCKVPVHIITLICVRKDEGKCNVPT
jgi:hypothetical protein